MSEYCDIFPEDPTCVEAEVEVTVTTTEEEPTNVDNTDATAGEGDDMDGDNESPDAEDGDDMDKDHDMMKPHKKGGKGMMMDMDMSDMTPSQMWMKAGRLMELVSASPMAGQLWYLFIATNAVVTSSLYLFRYSTTTNYYAKFLADPASTDWFKIGDKIQSYAQLAYFGIGWILQLLSIFGIAIPITGMYWVIGGGVWVLATFIAAVFKYIAYEEAYTNTETLALLVTAGTANIAVPTEMYYSAGNFVFLVSSLYMNYDNWMWGLYENMDQEMKESYMDMLQRQVDDWEAEINAEAGFDGEKKGKKGDMKKGDKMEGEKIEGEKMEGEGKKGGKKGPKPE